MQDGFYRQILEEYLLIFKKKNLRMSEIKKSYLFFVVVSLGNDNLVPIGERNTN